jgi:putative transposase
MAQQAICRGRSRLALNFKLAQAAEKHWRRLGGQNPLPKVILGERFTNKIEFAKEQAQTAA